MTTYPQEEIDQHYKKLPETLRDQLMSVENAEHIFEVGKKFGLTIEQTGFLGEESGFVVLGLTHPKDFVRRLSERLGIDMEMTKAIAQEVNHQIFFPLREMLRAAHQFELTQEQIQQPPPSLPPVSEPMRRETPLRAVPPSPPTPAANLRQIPEIMAKKPVAPSPQPVPSVPPAIRSPLAPLAPSALQEQKSGTPAPTASWKVGDLLKIKELPAPHADTMATPLARAGAAPTKTTATPAPSEKPRIPLAPSQIVQQKFAEQQEKKPISTQPEIEKMKESLFAPPSAPQQSKQEETSAIPTPPAPSAPPPVSKQSYPTHDPYREPIE